MIHGWTFSLSNEGGQTAVEYASVLALIAIAVAFALSPIPSDLFGSFWAAVHNALS